VEIKVFSEEAFVRFIADNKDALSKMPDKFCVIRIGPDPYTGFLPTELDNIIFSEEFENQIACFDFADIEDDFFEANKEHFLEAEKRLDQRQSPITSEEVLRIKSFIERNKDKEMLLIHCHAGECRSWSVAFCIAKYILKDDTLAQELRRKTIRFSKTIERRFVDVIEGSQNFMIQPSP